MVVVSMESKVFEHDAQQTGFDPNTHVDLGINYLRLISNEGENRILEGIRGTGKTHIMKMICHKCHEELESKRVVPVYISVAGLPNLALNNKRLFRFYFFSKIIKEISEFLLNAKDKLIAIDTKKKKSMLELIKNIFRLSPENELEKNFEYIVQITEKNLDLFSNNPEKLIQKVKEFSGENMKIGLEKIPLSIIGSNISSEEIERISEYASSKFLDLYSIDIVLKFLQQIKRLLNINYIYILIDECSETKKEIQVEILRFCKKIRGLFSSSMSIKPEIAFMISVYPTQYYPSISKGDDFNFEPGNDCTIEYLELDELSDEYESFFKQLMEYRLRSYNQEGTKEIKDVFENGLGLVLASYAAGGVPRRFLEIMKQAYDLLSKDFQSKIDIESVHKIKPKYIQEGIQKVIDGPLVLKNPKLNEQDRNLIDFIIRRLTKRNKTIETKKEKKVEKTGNVTLYFVTSSENEQRLANLINVGVIHDKKRSRSRKSTLTSQKTGTLYILDFGVAFHRGVIFKQRSVEIARKDLRESAARGFQYAIDIKFAEESMEEIIKELEDGLREIKMIRIKMDRALLEARIDKETYIQMIERQEKNIKDTEKSLQILKRRRDQQII